MIRSTTALIEGRVIVDYLGVAPSEAIFGARAGPYEKEVGKARDIASEEVETEARMLGANTIDGIDLDYEVVDSRGGMMMVSISGTVVKIK
jgi:uncharacterized protein YbjQ (UPF0145 family)